MKIKKLLVTALATMVLGGSTLCVQAADCPHHYSIVYYDEAKPQSTYTHMVTINGLNGTIALMDCTVTVYSKSGWEKCNACGILLSHEIIPAGQTHSVKHN